jgi:hypothetical protein
MLAMMIGLITAILLLPTWLPNMASSLVGESPKVYWYLSRATAFVSLTVLWVSMALGLGISNKMARLWPGAPGAFAIHEYVSLLGLAFALFHAWCYLATVIFILRLLKSSSHLQRWIIAPPGWASGKLGFMSG